MACLSGGDTEPRSAINHFVVHGSIFRYGKWDVRFRRGVIITRWWTTAVGWNSPQLSLAKWNPLPSLTTNRCPCLIVVMLLHYHSMHTSTFLILHISASLEINMLLWVTVQGRRLTRTIWFNRAVGDFVSSTRLIQLRRMRSIRFFRRRSNWVWGCPSFLTKVCISILME